MDDVPLPAGVVEHVLSDGPAPAGPLVDNGVFGDVVRVVSLSPPPPPAAVDCGGGLTCAGGICMMGVCGRSCNTVCVGVCSGASGSRSGCGVA